MLCGNTDTFTPKIVFSLISKRWHYNITHNCYFIASQLFDLILFYLLYSTPLSAIFQLYHGDQLQWRKTPEYPERTTDHGKATGKLYRLRLRVECTLFVIYKAGAKIQLPNSLSHPGPHNYLKYHRITTSGCIKDSLQFIVSCYWILELFRQCRISCFSFYHRFTTICRMTYLQQNVVLQTYVTNLTLLSCRVQLD